ncbi:alpha/beta hydrolase family protein [Nocardioides panaciterrulae]|uniref:Uncharacterized protein (DUF2141 family)/pimeloyl-ACP methyl ester carboxylesterase n=1 Tax=Nocardioides panaciterrulae TaxID=661492 RepID=A0A7Y9JCI1_9ACTN|nr:hypothetical protein [Nocardioides panaciterrulae]NYD43927.1 uncharacterized protein (DUF2141 family)/pimeloyl-ACP methyl ester carboxylesterase [Nocardioides panaciterrulae]NYD43996.1 uncharacterized protein (DUF2141 family)/pimeloyl-ACP methyl ester carboxylesterase [Nocardioides panaciterrulae]
MPDLDYAKVIGRFGLTVGDTGGDPDDNPDTVWCTAGRVLITPLNTFVKVAAGSPVPWTGGNAVIECAIDADGYLTYTAPAGGATNPFVYVVDLTSTKVNPQVPAGAATHRVTFSEVYAGTTLVDFPEFTCRLTAAGDGTSGAGVNDLTIVAPIKPGEATPITRGEQGTSVTAVAIQGADLVTTLSDGTTVNAGELPVGPGGSDAGVATYMDDPASDTSTTTAAKAKDPAHPLGAALTATIATQTADHAKAPDTLSLRRLEVLGRADSMKSLALSRQRYEDAASLNETWASLANWATTSTVQVSAGKLYYLSGTAATMTYDGLSLTSGRARLKTTLTVPAAGGAGSVVIGVVTSATGSPATSVLYGIQINNADNSVKEWRKSSGAVALANPTSNALTTLAAGTYAVVVSVDENGTSVALSELDGNKTALMFNARTGTAPARFAIYQGDNRGTSGIGVGATVIRAESVTSSNRAVEGAAPSAEWRYDAADASHPIHLTLPATYDSRKPVPLVIHHHGADQNELDIFTDSASPSVYEALLAAGYAVLSVNGGGNNWGNDAGQAKMLSAYKYVRDHYAIGPILLWGTSMGGIATLNALMQRAIPGIAGWLGTYPVCNLASMFANNAGTYAGQIRTAYGIAADGSDYATKTAGHDPAAAAAAAFRGVPMRFYASPSDTTVSKADNSDTLATLVAGYAPEATVVACTGNHGDASHFQPSDYVAFFNRCVGA